MTDTEQREIDAWIAEHVMGWDGVHFNGSIDRLSGKWYGYPRLSKPRNVAGDRPFETKLSDNSPYMEEIPHYSTFSGFPLLLEKLIADGYEVSTLSGKDRLSRAVISPGYFTATAPTLPLALALAARAAYSQPATGEKSAG